MAYKNNFFKLALSYDRKILASYKHQINVQSKLLQTVKAKLPYDLSTHALYCVAKEKKISLYTDSAVWASQLRFYHHAILKAIVDSNQGTYETLQIKVIPKVQKLENKAEKKFPPISHVNLILSQAEHQTDEKLKTALLKLGNTLKNKSL